VRILVEGDDLHIGLPHGVQHWGGDAAHNEVEWTGAVAIDECRAVVAAVSGRTRRAGAPWGNVRARPFSGGTPSQSVRAPCLDGVEALPRVQSRRHGDVGANMGVRSALLT
jgi:hypothetical protein